MNKRAILGTAAFFVAAFAIIMGFWMTMFVVANRLGFDSQSTPQYGFTSGIGPMLLTAIGMSTLATGAWHSMNCHEPGCPRIGRHKVSGTPWCNIHHEQARGVQTTDDLLRELITLLKEKERL